MSRRQRPRRLCAHECTWELGLQMHGGKVFDDYERLGMVSLTCSIRESGNETSIPISEIRIFFENANENAYPVFAIISCNALCTQIRGRVYDLN